MLTMLKDIKTAKIKENNYKKLEIKTKRPQDVGTLVSNASGEWGRHTTLGRHMKIVCGFFTSSLMIMVLSNTYLHAKASLCHGFP
jgi:hypothetical protein